MRSTALAIIRIEREHFVFISVIVLRTESNPARPSYSSGVRAPNSVHQRLLQLYLLPGVFELDDVNVHDFGATTSVGVSFSGARLFFVRSELKSTKSASSIFFHPFAVEVNSPQADCSVSNSALVGPMSMPFCEIGPRTVLKRLLTAMNDNKLPGSRATAPKPPPPPPPGPRPARCGPPNVANFVSRALAAVATSAGN